MTKIYLADRECKVNASEALQEIDKQYLGWGWNTEQTTLDLVDYAKSLERQLAEAMENIYKFAEIALMEGKDEFGHSWEDFKFYVLDEQLKEKG